MVGIGKSAHPFSLTIRLCAAIRAAFQVSLDNGIF
jgi:hypothetical protein